MKKYARYIIATCVIAGTLVWVLDAFKESLTRYVTIEEAKISEKRVQVVGAVLKGSASFDLNANRFSFSIKDGGKTLDIEYHGTKPGNFDDADKVVATGVFDVKRSIFKCDELLVKCPTKYEGRIEG